MSPRLIRLWWFKACTHFFRCQVCPVLWVLSLSFLIKHMRINTCVEAINHHDDRKLGTCLWSPDSKVLTVLLKRNEWIRLFGMLTAKDKKFRIFLNAKSFVLPNHSAEKPSWVLQHVLLVLFYLLRKKWDMFESNFKIVGLEVFSLWGGHKSQKYKW